MTKLFTAVFFCSLCVWLGISVGKMVIGYDVFVPGTVTVKNWYTAENIAQTAHLYTSLTAWAGWSFGIMVVSGFVGLLQSKRTWKREAWMLMVLIFLVLLIPAQAWSLWQDYLLWQTLPSGAHTDSGSLSTAVTVFSQRMVSAESSIVNGLTILTGITVAATLAIRPLTSHSSSEV